MRRLVILTLALIACALLIGSAGADPVPEILSSIVKAARAAVVVPQDWDGTWAAAESVYVCEGAFQKTGSWNDIICGGEEYVNVTSPTIIFACTGTADAATIDETCTGTGTVSPGCSATLTVVTHATRDGDTFFRVDTAQWTFSGDCSYTPQCTQYNVRGARIGPPPPGSCTTTPTRRSTWGEIKAIYR